MNVINQKEYQDWKDNNKDAYSAAIFRYAEKWAGAMEKEIELGNKIQDIARSLSFSCDNEGITGFMYGAAVSILSHCWIYGEELRIWHNLDTQISTEGEKANKDGGVLNPAIIKLG